MLALEEAQARILDAMMPPLAPEVALLPLAVGRVLTESISAALNLPGFNNSAMDGYAVRAEDVARASKEKPVILKLCGRIEAGEVSRFSVVSGSCARIFTGSAIPSGANAVVMQEDTTVDDNHSGKVFVLDRVDPGENVRRAGEDVQQGQELFAAGDTLTPGGAGLLAALGIKEVKVGRRPVVGLLATGSELCEPGQPLPPGKIYESNRTLLAPFLDRAGAVTTVFPMVLDTKELTRGALTQAMQRCDAVVTTGGVSVGELDLVRAAFEDLGGQIAFWKVAMKPGKPFVFGRLGGKFLFGLPGNPVSALVTFLELVWPALRRWQGAKSPLLPTYPGILAETLQNRDDRRHFIRVKVDADGNVRSAGTQASHVLSSLAQANGLVELPAGCELMAGSVVKVLRIDM